MGNFSKWETSADLHVVKKPFSPRRGTLEEIFHPAVKINHCVLPPLTDEIYRCCVDDLWRGSREEDFLTTLDKAEV